MRIVKYFAYNVGTIEELVDQRTSSSLNDVPKLSVFPPMHALLKNTNEKLGKI